MKQPFAGLIVALAALGLASHTGAQVPDHLKCYKVKDPQTKAVYTADLGGLQAEPGCMIKVPGKLLCVEATKTNVTPTPPGVDDTGAAGRFLCYKVKCPKATQPTVTWSDQFGTRSLTPGVPKVLCAPEIVSTTTNPTPCGNLPYPMCNGSCPAGQACVAVRAVATGLDGGSYCGCAPTPVCCDPSTGCTDCNLNGFCSGGCPGPTGTVCFADIFTGEGGCALSVSCCGNLVGGAFGPSCMTITDSNFDPGSPTRCTSPPASGTYVNGAECNGFTGMCDFNQIGIEDCCQYGSICFEGPHGTVNSECGLVAGSLRQRSRCLANGQCDHQ